MKEKNDPGLRRLPVLGWRIVKTTVAVFICLMIYLIRGYSGADMPTESAITAIVCMQPYLRDSGTFALNRMAGTLVGTFWGLVFLALLLIFPQLAGVKVLIYALMALGGHGQSVQCRCGGQGRFCRTGRHRLPLHRHYLP